MRGTTSLAEMAAGIGADTSYREFVTMRVGPQMFGISVHTVQDVLRGLKIARIPLAPKEIAGSMNLRGRIVTVIDMRQRLNLPPADEIGVKQMSVVVECKDELFSLLVDSVGEVMSLPMDKFEKSPANLSPKWREVAEGIYRLKDELLVILDVKSLLRFT